MLIEDIVQTTVCERRNSDTRNYKVLMNVAGDSRQFALTPKTLKAAAAALVGLLQPAEKAAEYVVGFAPGGIPIAVAMSYELDTPAIVAYKTRLGLPDEITWIEPHCHTNTFFFYGVTAGMSVLLIDDEVDSGNTLANAATALTVAGVQVTGVAAAVEVTHRGRSQGRERLQELGFDLHALRRVDIDSPQA